MRVDVPALHLDLLEQRAYELAGEVNIDGVVDEVRRESPDATSAGNEPLDTAAVEGPTVAGVSRFRGSRSHGWWEIGEPPVLLHR